MPPPTAAEVKVATDALRTEAGVWDTQADEMHAISLKVAGLHMSRLEAGMFQVVVSAYDGMVEQVALRCQEGHDRMRDIGTTLRQVADTYQSEDESGAHRIKNLY
jgi:uncharacterized protein YukE